MGQQGGWPGASGLEGPPRRHHTAAWMISGDWQATRGVKRRTRTLAPSARCIQQGLRPADSRHPQHVGVRSRDHPGAWWDASRADSIGRRRSDAGPGKPGRESAPDLGQQTVETIGAGSRVGLGAAGLHQGSGTRGAWQQFGGEGAHAPAGGGSSRALQMECLEALRLGTGMIARTYWARSKAARGRGSAVAHAARSPVARGVVVAVRAAR